MADSYRDLRRLLLAAGCFFLREGRGDHEIRFSPLTNDTFAVDRGTKSRHMANGVPEDAGLPKAF